MMAFRIAVTFVLLMFSSICASIEYHVALSGSDSSGNGSSTSPWRTPEYGAKQLGPGDILSIHAGTYALSTSNLPSGQTAMHRARALVSPPTDVSGSASSPIIIRSAGDGTVLLDAGTSPQWPAVGTNSGDYLTLDGLSVRGAAILWSTTGSTVKNCNLFGGIDTPLSNGGDNFGVVLRVELCTDCLVRNNLLHDNQSGITRDNSPLLIEYDSTNLIVENNDVYNSVGIGIRLKDNPEQVHIRNNYFYDNFNSGLQGANQDSGNDVFIYRNIFRNNNTSKEQGYGGVSQLVELRSWRIYNNTFVNNGAADIRSNFAGTEDTQAWNNIYYNNDGLFYSVGWSSTGATFAGQWTYSDYNVFFGSANWEERSTSWNSLSSFSSARGFDSNSVTTDPGFKNANGTAPSDFKRNAYPTNGRGGSYPDVIGAYVTGNEQIGSAGVRLTPKKIIDLTVD